jgi:hypothetical protein
MIPANVVLSSWVGQVIWDNVSRLYIRALMAESHFYPILQMEAEVNTTQFRAV